MNETPELWSWWVGALGLSGVAGLSLVATGRRLGVSGAVGRLVAAAESRKAHQDAPEATNRPGSSLLFLGGIALGGLLAGGGTGTTVADAAWAERFGGGASALAAAVVGGLLVGFGTRVSGGCTSGHGLVGCALLSPRSLVATAAFFGTAIAVSLSLDVIGGAP
jgi:uncharacterized membrane protein YedE/YeeE